MMFLYFYVLKHLVLSRTKQATSHIKTKVPAAFLMLLIFLPCNINAENNLQAEKLYQQYCSVCHGENGDGDTHARQGLQPPPQDFTKLSVAQLSHKEMLNTIQNGRPGTAMAAWKNKLDKTQIESIVNFIRANFMPSSIQTDAFSEHQTKTHPGQGIYAETCSVCHGDNGQGAVWGKDSLNPPPRDFTTEATLRELSRQRMLASVTNGRPGTAMSAYASRLSQYEIEIVVDYILKTFLKEHGDETATPVNNIINQKAEIHNIANTDAEQQLTGSLSNGKQLYLQNCSACHGDSGDGNGPRAYFIFPKPRNFLQSDARTSFDRKSLFSAIENGVRGKEMPAWGKVLSEQQITDVAEYVYQTFINSTSSSVSLKQ